MQLSKLNNEGLVPYVDLVPLRQPCPAMVRWAPWGKTMWRYHKAWCLARVTGGIPLVIWGGSEIPVTLDCCCLCGAVEVGLAHVLAECPQLLAQRANLESGAADLLPQWALTHSDDIGALAPRVRYFGVCVGAIASGRY